MMKQKLDRILLRLRSLVRREAVEGELDAEIQFHLERQTLENRERGMPPGQARVEALRQLGIVSAVQEDCRDARRVNMIEQFLQDLRYALRGLRTHPGFTAVAMLTLAIGIGSNTAIFSIVNAVLFRPLPYPAPERLVALETRNTKQLELDPMSSPQDFYDLRDRARSFDAMGAVTQEWNVVVSGERGSEQASALYTSASLLPLLGATPVHGRNFLPEEDQRAKPRTVVMLGHAYWLRHFGGAASAVGQSLNIEGASHVIVGVLPTGFRYLGNPSTANDVDLWLPLASNPILNRGRGVRYLNVAGRLRPQVAPAQAEAEVTQIWAALARQYADSNSGYEMRMMMLEERAIGKARSALLLLLAVVGFVLLIACVNVANLLLTRTMARRTEIALRKALGATTGRLARQLLTESFALAGLGGIAGLLLARVILPAFLAIAPAALPRRTEVALDTQALAFTALAVLLTAVFCGLAPVADLIWRDVNSTLKEGGRSFIGGANRLRRALVITEIAVAILLLAGSGLLIRGFLRLLAVDPGFSTENVWTGTTQVPRTYATPQKRFALYGQLEAKLREIPGVRHVGAVSRLPLLGANLGTWLSIEGRPFPRDQRPEVEYRVASAGYFQAMGIPLRGGRLYDQRDDANPSVVCLINETMAKRYWPNENALGKRISFGGQEGPWVEIIGLVGDVRHVSLDIAPRAEVYRPYAHNPLFAPIFVVRGPANPATLATAFRAVEPQLPVYGVYEMKQLVERANAHRRFPMLVLSGFAVAALLLAAVGIYGVVSQFVSQRTREIGLRVAMGASLADVLRLILWQGLRLSVTGAVIGIIAAGALTRLLSTLLFEVSALDPVTFLAAPLALTLVAATASFLPAWRAAGLDPQVALRHE